MITAATGWPLPIGLPSVTKSGHDAVALEAPQPVAGAAVSGLDLVGDAHARRPAGLVDERLHVGGVEIGDPVAGDDAVEDRGGERDPPLGRRVKAAENPEASRFFPR